MATLNPSELLAGVPDGARMLAMTSSDLPTTPPAQGPESRAGDGQAADGNPLLHAARHLAAAQGGRAAWVWAGDGASLIFANAEGMAVLGLDATLDRSVSDIKPSVPARRSLQAVGRMPVGGNGRGRIEILRISVGGRHETLVATCRSVDLAGTVGVLALGTAAGTQPVASQLPAMDAAPAATDPDIPSHSGDAVAVHQALPSRDADDAGDGHQSDAHQGDEVQTDDPFVLAIDAPTFEAQRPATMDQGPSARDGDQAASFAFKPRSRPHRFSFMVDQDGRVRSLSSGMADGVGAGAALRDGEVAHEAVRRADPDAPHAVLSGLEARERFSEHGLWWPVDGTDLAVPVRLSAFGEDDGELRVFGTVATAGAVPRRQPDMQTAAAQPVMTVQALDDEALSEANAVYAGLHAAPEHDAIDGEAHEPVAAADSASKNPTPKTPAPTVQPTSTGMQFPGGVLLTQAAAAMAAGISAGLRLPLPATALDAPVDRSVNRSLNHPTDHPVDDPVNDPLATPRDDALSEADATMAGLYTPVQADRADPPSSAITALDDALRGDEAQAAGLWSKDPAEDPPHPDVSDAGVPADIAKGMQAVAAGVAAGLGAGTLAALKDEQDSDEADDDRDSSSSSTAPTDDDAPSPGSPADVFDTASGDPSLVRPERLTFQEIARRLGARIAHQVTEPDASPSPEATPEPGNGQDPTARLSQLDSDATAHPGQADVISLDPQPMEGDASHDRSDETEERRGSAQVLPFTRSEPSAERMVLDRLPLGIIIYCEEAILYANRAALEMAGLHSLQALKAYRGIEALFTEGFAAEDGAMTLVQPGGTRVPVTGRLQSVRWDGRAAALLSLREGHRADRSGEVAPKTTSKTAPKTLHEDETLGLVRARIGELEAIVDLASDGVVTLDGEGTIKDINQAAQALVGYAVEDLKGRPFRLLFAEDSRQIALDYLEDIASQGRLSLFNEGREVECLSAQGGLVPVFMTLGRLTDDEPATYCAVLRDLSPFKQAEDDLVAARHAAEEANAHKSDFLARVSHEIRTPLNAVIGFSEVMLEERFGPVGSERYRQYLRDIHTSGEHLMSLLNDLLDLSKIEAGKMDLSFGEVDLNDMAQQSLAIMQPQASQGRIIVRTSLPQSLPKVVADGRSIRQIVLNLISNAIKFTDPGGQIIVSTLYEPTGEVSLRVRDTGRGMSEADVKLAMEPFRQVPTTLNQVITGTGLGLPLTKALVEANKAQFALESTPGEGTLVKVTFPLQRVLAE